jgi:hypothetical protein
MAQVDIQADLSKLLSELSHVQSAVQSLQAEMRQTGQAGQAGFEKAGKSLEHLGIAAQKSSSQIGDFFKGGLILQAFNQFAAAVGAFGSEILRATAAFQKFEIQLTKQFGSKQLGKEAFADLRKFAAETPFQLEEVVGAFIKLKQRGLEPTKADFKQLGDLALSQGKSLDQLVEAVLDAQTGEFERLKEFGIVVRKQGDDFKVQFGTLAPVLLKSADAVEKYVVSLGLLPSVQGTSAEVAQTLGGALSNLQDSYTNLAATIGDRASPVLVDAVNVLRGVLDAAAELTSTFEVSGVSASNFSATFDEIKQAAAPVADAIGRYIDVLKGAVLVYDDYAKSVFGSDEASTALRASIELVSAILTRLIDNLTFAAQAISDFSKPILKETAPIVRIILDLFSSLSKLLVDLLGDANEAGTGFSTFGEIIATVVLKPLNGLVTAASAIIKGLFGISDEISTATPFFRVLGEAVEVVTSPIRGFIILLKEGADAITDFFGIVATESEKAASATARRVKEQEAADAKLLKGIEAEQQAAKDAVLAEVRANDAAVAAQKKAAATRQALTEKEIKEREKLQKEHEKAVLDGMAEGADKEIAVENAKFAELEKQLNKFGLSTAGAVKNHENAIAAIRFKYIKKEQADRLKAFTDQLATEEVFDKTLAAREAEKAARTRKFLKEEAELSAAGGSLSQLATLRAKFNKDLHDIDAKFEAENFTEREAALKKRQDFELAHLDADQATLLSAARNNKKLTADQLQKLEETLTDKKKEFELQQQKELLQLRLNFDASLTEQDKAAISEQIRAIDAGLAELKGKAAKGAGNGVSIWDLLGIGGKEDAGKREAVKKAVEETVSAINQIAAARVEAANAARQAADDQVQAAQDALEKEQSLAEQGFANNVSLRQRELADALAAQEKAKKAQEKAAKAQFAIDTLTQTVSLVTASANIFKSLSNIPIIGVPLAIGTIAAMFAAFAATRSNALKATKFRHGGGGYVDENGVIVGNSHERGGVTVPEYEGGEFFGSDGKRFAVVNKRMTGKHFDLLSAINRDDRAEIQRQAFGLTGGISLRREAFEAGTRPIGAAQTVVIGADRSEEIALLREQNRHLKTLVDRRQVHDMGDHLLIIEGDKQTKIRKNG